MNLPPASHAYIAQRAQFYFDCATSPRSSPTAFGDNCIFTGQGLRDLNQTIDFIANNPTVRIMCEVGAPTQIMLGNSWPKYLPCDIQDVYAIKEAFIAFYGSVDKPNVFRNRSEGAFQHSQGTVALPVVITSVNGVFQYGQGTVAQPVVITGTAAGSNSAYLDA